MKVIRENCRYLLAGLTLAIAPFVWFASTYHGPELVPATVTGTRYSGERALNVLEKLLGDETPHPAGSPANAEFRRKLVRHLTDLQLTVEQTPFEVKGVSMCNVLARIKGSPDGRPILLATHYDSVEQGPGAGDAGSCVAALLETARILQLEKKANRDQLTSDVYFLFTDGEEWVRRIGRGLNGAEYFVNGSPHEVLSRNPLVLNFDARGASGASVMYETSPQNLALISEVQKALPRPAYTASSYVTVYDLLPNATDFTIFRTAGFTGLNFAFLDDPHRYHTAQDSLEFLDPRSVQHHGENALRLTQHFLSLPDVDLTETRNAVFFTFMNRWFVSYPASYASPCSFALLLLQLIGSWRQMKRGTRFTEVALSCLAIAVIMMSGILVGAVINNLNTYRPQSFHGFGPYDPLIVGALWLLILAFATFTMTRVFRATTTGSTWVVVWTGNAIVGVASAALLPGFSYIMLTIGAVPAILGLLPHDKRLLSVIAVAVAGLFHAPLAYQFGIALGPKMAFALGGLFVAFLTPLFPLLCHQPEPNQPKSSPNAVKEST